MALTKQQAKELTDLIDYLITVRLSDRADRDKCRKETKAEIEALLSGAAASSVRKAISGK